MTRAPGIAPVVAPVVERHAACACGRVRLRLVGKPIVAASCCCSDCQAAGRIIEALPGAAPIREPCGGSPYLVYRDDRLEIEAGAELLRGVKLSDKAPTTRYVATCCNSGMHLKHRPGWWASVYRARVPDAPPLTLRNKVAALPPGTPVPTDIPAYKGYPPQLFLRLLAARLAMALRR